MLTYRLLPAKNDKPVARGVFPILPQVNLRGGRLSIGRPTTAATAAIRNIVAAGCATAPAPTAPEIAAAATAAAA
jgi:hypothetical protein